MTTPPETQRTITLTEAMQQLDKEASKDPESWVSLKRLFARIQVGFTKKLLYWVSKKIPSAQKQRRKLKGHYIPQLVIQRKAIPLFRALVPDLLAPNHREDTLFLRVVAFLKKVEANKPGSGEAVTSSSLHRSLGTLFQKAEDALRQGKFSLSCVVYQKLFEVCDCGLGLQFAGAINIEHHQVKALYLRSLYETTPPELRPEKIIDAIRSLEKKTPGFTLPLTTMIKTLPVSPVGLDDFLSSCVTLLNEASSPEELRWLKEASELSKGANGLAVLARVEGASWAYLSWLSSLEKQGRYSEVETAANEALGIIPKEESSRARVADFLFEVAKRRESIELMRTAREEAFYSGPSLRRLLDLWEATPAQERPLCMERVLAILHDVPRRLVKELFDDTLRPMRVGKSFMLHALLLSGRVKEAMSSVTKNVYYDEEEAEGASALLLAFSLVVLSKQATQNLPSSVSALWTQTVKSASLYGYSEKTRIQERLEKAYEQLFSSMEPKKVYGLMGWSLEQAKQKILPALQTKERKQYERVTCLIVACIEVLELQGRTAEANSFCLEMQLRFARRFAFQKMLSATLQQSRRETQMDASSSLLAM